MSIGCKFHLVLYDKMGFHQSNHIQKLNYNRFGVYTFKLQTDYVSSVYLKFDDFFINNHIKQNVRGYCEYIDFITLIINDQTILKISGFHLTSLGIKEDVNYLLKLPFPNLIAQQQIVVQCQYKNLKATKKQTIHL